MQPASSDRRSTYLDALTLEIERKLRKALNSPGQRPDLLQQLFADVALEIDDQAFDKIFNKDEDQIGTVNYGIDTTLCFYDVLVDYYVEEPEKGKRILDLIVQLWSQSFVSHIFALLFHKWLFEVSVENTEALLRYGSALVQGAGNVFWIDIQTNRRRFISLFTYLLEDVALVPERSVKISLQMILEIFLNFFPTFPNTILIGGPADIFVIELPDQLHFSWRAYVSDKSCTTRGLGYIGSSLSSWTISSSCHKPLLSIAVSLVLSFLLLEFYYDMRQDGRTLLHRSLRKSKSTRER